MMELDFAFLAEWARAEDGATVTAAGGGLSRVRIAPGDTVSIHVAARFVRDQTDGGHSVSLSILNSGTDVMVTANSTIDPVPADSTNPQPSLVFTVAMPVALAADDYHVVLFVDEAIVKRLPLSVAFVSEDND